jgi:uncharacterized protein (DUF983 family)
MAAERRGRRADVGVPARTFYMSLVGVYALMMSVVVASRPEAASWLRNAVVVILLVAQLVYLICALRSPVIRGGGRTEAEADAAAREGSGNE